LDADDRMIAKMMLVMTDKWFYSKFNAWFETLVWYFSQFLRVLCWFVK
jgi:hypothetical protein